MREVATKGLSGAVNVRFFELPDDLAQCFSTIYRVTVQPLPDGKVSDCLLPEWGNLRMVVENPPTFTLSTGGEVTSHFAATGPRSHPVNFEVGPCTLWGMGILPVGWARYINAPAKDCADRVFDGMAEGPFSGFTPLCRELCASQATEEEDFERIVEFSRALAPPPKDEARITSIHTAMADPYLIEVPELADRVGMTVRTLERMCARYFGFPPRLMLRRQRLIRSLTAFLAGGAQNWSKTMDSHYHDHAHFVREFHSFMGMSPTQYAQMDHPILDAFVAERRRIWGLPAPTSADIPATTTQAG